MMLKELTENYIKAFNDKNLIAIRGMTSDDFCLEDPVIVKSTSKQHALTYIKNIFDNTAKLDFIVKSLIVCSESQVAIIEFKLILDQQCFNGVDIVEWQNNKISSLRAYLNAQE